MGIDNTDTEDATAERKLNGSRNRASATGLSDDEPQGIAALAAELPGLIEDLDFAALTEPLREMVREKPLQALGIGVGVGFLLGKLLR